MVEAALTAHDEALDDRRLVEERRLFYVALTRAERVLLVSGHRWGPTGDRPRQPSVFLHEIRDTVEATGVGRVEHWAEEPEYGAANPATAEPVTAEWPVDPLGARSRRRARRAPSWSARPLRGRRLDARHEPPTDPGARAPGLDREPTARRPGRGRTRRAGPPTSTCSSPSAPPPASAPSSRCPRSCR